MPAIIQIKSNIYTIVKWIDKNRTRIPKVTERILDTVQDIISTELYWSWVEAGIQEFTGRAEGWMFEWDRRYKSTFLWLPVYAIYLDRMRPHLVYVRGKPELEDWVLARFGFFVNKLYVRPHPWIERGVQRALAVLRDYLEREKVIIK